MRTDRACHRTVLALPWLLNGSLEATERREVREHLIACPACRAELVRTREARALFQPAASPAVVAEAPPTPVTGISRPSQSTLRRLSWAAMIGAVLGSSWAIWWIHSQGLKPEVQAYHRSPAHGAAVPVPVRIAAAPMAAPAAVSAEPAGPVSHGAATAGSSAKPALAHRSAASEPAIRSHQGAGRISSIGFESGSLASLTVPAAASRISRFDFEGGQLSGGR